MTDVMRAEIAQSWQRSRSSGLAPADSVERVSVSDVDRRSRLLAAANPVLDRMESVLAGTGYCVLLADRDARLVDLRFGTHRVQDAVTATGAVVGRAFTEETSGTNSIATVYKTHSPLAVRGEEHYFEGMKHLSCYGYPLLHPVTGRIEGVLDITFLASEDNPLLEPMLVYAARDIQGRLVEVTRTSEQLLFAEFQRASTRRRGAPVVAIADEILLENTAAGRAVSAADHNSLRALTDGAIHRRGSIPRMMLSCGIHASIRWERPEAGVGIVVEIDLIDDDRGQLTALDQAMRAAIVAELDRQNGNKRTTAETLGISRTTLYKRMRELEIFG